MAKRHRPPEDPESLTLFIRLLQLGLRTAPSGVAIEAAMRVTHVVRREQTPHEAPVG